MSARRKGPRSLTIKDGDARQVLAALGHTPRTIAPAAGHYERIPLPADPRLPERRFTVGKFVRAGEEPSR